MRPLPFALLFAAAAAIAAEPSLRTRLLPAKDPVWEGQRLRFELEFTEGNGRLDNLVPAGIPDGPDGPVRLGPFERSAARVRGAQAYAATLSLLRPGTVAFAPSLKGEEVWFQNPFLLAPSRRPVELRDTPFSLDVRPLPADAPDGFCGAVGSFRLEAAFDETSCAPGDVATLRWTLSGLGADAATNVPSYAPGPAFRVYPPRVERRGDFELAVSQDVVPTAEAEGPLPPFGVCVFDVASGSWKTLSSAPLALRVEERPAPAPAPAPDAPAKQAPVEVRVAPAETALSLFTVRPDAALHVRERSGGWVRILRDDGASGWIPASALPSGNPAKGTAP